MAIHILRFLGILGFLKIIKNDVKIILENAKLWTIKTQYLKLRQSFNDVRQPSTNFDKRLTNLRQTFVNLSTKNRQAFNKRLDKLFDKVSSTFRLILRLRTDTNASLRLPWLSTYKAWKENILLIANKIWKMKDIFLAQQKNKIIEKKWLMVRCRNTETNLKIKYIHDKIEHDKHTHTHQLN